VAECHVGMWEPQVQGHIFYGFYIFTCYDFYLIGINRIPVAVNTVSCTPDDGCKHTRNMLSDIAVK
jgi:hypothetical protein